MLREYFILLVILYTRNFICMNFMLKIEILLMKVYTCNFKCRKKITETVDMVEIKE